MKVPVDVLYIDLEIIMIIMNKPITVLLALFFLSFSSLAIADEDPLLNIANPYIRFSIGATAVTATGEEGWGGTAALMLSGGFELNRLLGVEAGVHKAATVFVDINNAYLSLVARHTISEKTTLAGKLGITKSTIDITNIFGGGNYTEDNGVNGMIGVELRYIVSERLTSTLEFDHFGGELAVNSASVGIQYNF